VQKKVHRSSGADDQKLQATLKKMNVQPITQIEEVNMFKSDGNVIHFSAPKGMPNTILEHDLGQSLTLHSPRRCAFQHLRHLRPR
jgi:hypothetical protein